MQKRCIMQCRRKAEQGLSFLLLSSLFQPPPLPLVHQHVQLKVGLLSKLRSTLVAGHLRPFLSRQLVCLPMKMLKQKQTCTKLQFSPCPCLKALAQEWVHRLPKCTNPSPSSSSHDPERMKLEQVYFVILGSIANKLSSTLRYLISLLLASSLFSPFPAQAFPWIQARATIRVAWKLNFYFGILDSFHLGKSVGDLSPVHIILFPIYFKHLNTFDPYYHGATSTKEMWKYQLDWLWHLFVFSWIYDRSLSCPLWPLVPFALLLMPLKPRENLRLYKNNWEKSNIPKPSSDLALAEFTLKRFIMLPHVRVVLPLLGELQVADVAFPDWFHRRFWLTKKLKYVTCMHPAWSCAPQWSACPGYSASRTCCHL